MPLPTDTECSYPGAIHQRGNAARKGIGTGLLTLLIPLLATGEAKAQNRPEILELPPTASGYIRTGGLFHGNFFQLPDGGPRQDVLAGLLEVRVEDWLGLDGAFRAYVRGDLFQFQHLGYSPGIVAGLRRVQGRHQFDVSMAAQWNRPRFDSGDELEQADIAAGYGTYSVRVIAPLELVALAEYRRESLKLRRQDESESHEVGAAVRVHGFGRRLSAEVGRLQGGREATNLNEAYFQEATYVLVRTTAIPRTYASVRVRERLREYTVEDPASRNFGREDRRQQITCYLDINLWGNLVWNLSGGLEKGDSSRPGRGFRSKQFGTTVSVMLAGS